METPDFVQGWSATVLLQEKAQRNVIDKYHNHNDCFAGAPGNTGVHSKLKKLSYILAWIQYKYFQLCASTVQIKTSKQSIQIPSLLWIAYEMASFQNYQEANWFFFSSIFLQYTCTQTYKVCKILRIVTIFQLWSLLSDSSTRFSAILNLLCLNIPCKWHNWRHSIIESIWY